MLKNLRRPLGRTDTDAELQLLKKLRIRPIVLFPVVHDILEANYLIMSDERFVVNCTTGFLIPQVRFLHFIAFSPDPDVHQAFVRFEQSGLNRFAIADKMRCLVE
ncbi:hypothetical protein D3C73_1396380 [compost metagenome]